MLARYVPSLKMCCVYIESYFPVCIADGAHSFYGARLLGIHESESVNRGIYTLCLTKAVV